MKLLLLLLLGLFLMGASCASRVTPVDTLPTDMGTVDSLPTDVPDQAEEDATKPMYPDTILVSTEDALTYCNGADMDSDGFRATITKEKPFTISADATLAERVKAAIVQATDGQYSEVLSRRTVTVEDGVVMIEEIGAWAGVSIAECSNLPLLEVNALRIPGVTRIEWVSRTP